MYKLPQLHYNPMSQALLESLLQIRKPGAGRFRPLAPDRAAVNGRVQVGVWAVGLLSPYAPLRSCAFSQSCGLHRGWYSQPFPPPARPHHCPIHTWQLLRAHIDAFPTSGNARRFWSWSQGERERRGSRKAPQSPEQPERKAHLKSRTRIYSDRVLSF